MPITFLHSADWQIGKVFRYADEATMARLQQARLEGIDRIGDLARERGAKHVLVAGDVYDTQDVSDRLLLQPVERMRVHGDVTWHLLPGNHDPHRPFGIWERLRSSDLPANIVCHTAAEAWVDHDARLAILPAPLLHYTGLEDLTAYMDKADTPDGYFRIGLAHGSIRGFGANEEAAANFIDPTRTERAGLDYLALGDWHGRREISPRVHYSGTHEVDGFEVDGGGHCLLVSIAAPGELPQVEAIRTGEFHWHKLRANLSRREDVDALEARLRGLAPGSLSKHLIDLEVSGALSLGDLDYFRARIETAVDAAFALLRVRAAELVSEPTDDDLAEFGEGGYVRAAADELMQQATADALPEAERRRARLALLRLYLLYRGLSGDGDA
ncbi:MAG: metallophosphoesterase [Halieaceae bacterium]|jgi:DNA repair exonuclease SbcCD nuclease subunit|nr:metallophosphoesterase [Halieaceae bacterium]